MEPIIYLDHMATTPVDPQVIEKMNEYLGVNGIYANPASTSHALGRQALQAVEQSREAVADLIGADRKEIIWTSGATESDNLAIIGAALFYQSKGRHIITTQIEHKAVLDSCAYLAKQGFTVTYLAPDKDGIISVDALAKAIQKDTILLSVMHASNEIGVIQPIEQLARLAKSHGILVHVDAAQTAGKLAIDVSNWPVDLLSLSAHKMYGPKGIGALYVRRQPRVRLQPLMHGGGHEQGLRSGTLPTHQIAGMAEACRLAKRYQSQDCQRVGALTKRLWQGIKSVEGVGLNGHPDNRLYNNLNVHVKGVDGEALVVALRQLAISSTSACSSASLEPSYVLRAIGLSDSLAYASVRLSPGRFTSEQDIDRAIDIFCQQVAWLRQIAPC